jgi:hypothetical protein
MVDQLSWFDGCWFELKTDGGVFKMRRPVTGRSSLSPRDEGNQQDGRGQAGSQNPRLKQ